MQAFRQAVTVAWARLSTLDPGWLLVLALPLAMWVVNSDWVFTNPLAGEVDPWIYTGYFVNFSHHMRLFPNTYFGTRLSWTLVGAAAHHLFDPLIANHAIRLGLCYLSLGSLYLILREMVSRRAGVFGVLVMGCSVAFLRTVGWDYHNNIDNAF